jgi:hypothetical protein
LALDFGTPPGERAISRLDLLLRDRSRPWFSAAHREGQVAQLARRFYQLMTGLNDALRFLFPKTPYQMLAAIDLVKAIDADLSFHDPRRPKGRRAAI